jgi:hypothetical protein
MNDNWANAYQNLDQFNQMQQMLMNDSMNNPMNNPMNLMCNLMNQSNCCNLMNNNMMFNQMNNPQMFNQMNNPQMFNPMNDPQMLNLMNLMNNNQMNNNNPFMQMYNQMGNQFMNMNMQNNNNNIKNEKINLCFSTMQGSRIMMKFDPDETVEGALKKYLLRVGLPDLIGKIDKKIIFLLSAQSLKFGDKRKLKDLICEMGNANQILVNDIHNLIGAKFK